MKRLVSLIVVSLVVLSPSFAQKPTIQHTTNIPSKPDLMMPLVFPLYLEDAEFSNTLVLVNAGISTSPLDVVLRNEDGFTLTKQRIQVPGLSQQRIPVADLLRQAATLSRKGSIVLTGPSTSSAAITGALSITQTTPYGLRYIDEEPAMPPKEGSSLLRTVTDAVTTSPVISVTSLSASQQTITFSCISPAGLKRSGTVTLPMGATRAVSVCSDNEKQEDDSASRRDDEKDHHPIAYGITLSSNQASGSFAAFGHSKHYAEGTTYLTSVPFTDPMVLQSPNTVFAGVPIGSVNSLTAGKYAPALTAANFSAKAAHITALYYTSGQPIKLADVMVGAGRSTTVDLSDVAGNSHIEDSIVVTSDGAPGEVISKLTSVGTGALKQIEIPGKDEGDTLNSGQHPWSLQDGNDSTLLLFNHSDAKASFEVEVDQDDVAWNKHYSLSPKQTLAIDIRSLIDRAVPDDKGMKLPRLTGKSYGEVAWNTDGPGIAAGRLLQTNRSGAMARSFSCGAYTYLCGLDGFYPGSIGVGFYGAGRDTGISTCQSVGRCSNGEPASRGVSISRYIWRTNDASIVSIPGSASSKQASFYGVAVGSTSGYNEACDVYGCCVTRPFPMQTFSVKINSADVTQDSISVTTDGPDYTQGTFTLQLVGASSTQTLYQGAKSKGTGVFTFNLPSLPIQEYTSIAASWAPNNQTISATYAYHIRVLGNTTMTQYNTPSEHSCGGSPQADTVFDNSCKVTDASLASGFIFRVTNPAGGTGSGNSNDFGQVYQEGYCSGHSQSSLRSFQNIHGTLGALGDTTLAACPSGRDYAAGAQIYIMGQGVKTVTDRCPACCGGAHFDNYSTSSQCNGLGSLPSAVTVRIY